MWLMKMVMSMMVGSLPRTSNRKLWLLLLSAAVADDNDEIIKMIIFTHPAFASKMFSF